MIRIVALTPGVITLNYLILKTINQVNTTKEEDVRIAAIIFSKDRAMQLDCLLRSIAYNMTVFDEIYVLVKTTTELSDLNYSNLSRRFYGGITFITERDFYVDVLELSSYGFDYFAFFVDDDIVYNKVDPIKLLDALSDDNVDILSIRLGKNAKQKHIDYKGSLDGNIYPVDLLSKLIDCKFSNPNKLEIQLCKIARECNMTTLNEQKLISIPHNTVSDTSTCSNMGGCTTKLDIMYDNGYRIDFENMELGSNEPHQEIEYKFYNVNTMEAR